MQLKDANVEHPSGAWWQITAEMHQEDQLEPVSTELAGVLTAAMPAVFLTSPLCLAPAVKLAGPFPRASEMRHVSSAVPLQLPPTATTKAADSHHRCS